MITKTDSIIIIIALVFVSFLYINYWGDKTQGFDVRIMSGQDKAQILSLGKHQRIIVQGPLGPSTIEIKDGRVHFQASPCQNKQCIHSGWLDKSGEVAACLPNRITIAVLGKEQRYDSMNF